MSQKSDSKSSQREVDRSQKSGTKSSAREEDGEVSRCRVSSCLGKSGTNNSLSQKSNVKSSPKEVDRRHEAGVLCKNTFQNARDSKLIRLTADQAAGLRFPPGCPVWRHDKRIDAAAGPNSRSAFSGTVTSALMDLKSREVVYEVEPAKGGDFAKAPMMPESELTFGLDCPVYVSSTRDEREGSPLQGRILFCESSSLSIVMVQKEGNLFQVMKGVPLERIRYRKDTKTEEPVFATTTTTTTMPSTPSTRESDEIHKKGPTVQRPEASTSGFSTPCKKAADSKMIIQQNLSSKSTTTMGKVPTKQLFTANINPTKNIPTRNQPRPYQEHSTERNRLTPISSSVKSSTWGRGRDLEAGASSRSNRKRSYLDSSAASSDLGGDNYPSTRRVKVESSTILSSVQQEQSSKASTNPTVNVTTNKQTATSQKPPSEENHQTPIRPSARSPNSRRGGDSETGSDHSNRKQPYLGSFPSITDFRGENRPATQHVHVESINAGGYIKQYCKVHVPHWLVHDSASKDRLHYHLTKGYGGRKSLITIGNETNCIVDMIFPRHGPLYIQIESKPGPSSPRERMKLAKEGLEKALLEFLHRDGSSGRLLYDMAKSCKYLHPPSIGTAVSQCNPNSTDEMGWLDIVEIPYTKHRFLDQKVYHAQHIFGPTGALARIRRETGCSIQLCGNGFDVAFIGGTHLCEPYISVFGRHPRNVARAVLSLKNEIRSYTKKCDCVWKE